MLRRGQWRRHPVARRRIQSRERYREKAAVRQAASDSSRARRAAQTGSTQRETTSSQPAAAQVPLFAVTPDRLPASGGGPAAGDQPPSGTAGRRCGGPRVSRTWPAAAAPPRTARPSSTPHDHSLPQRARQPPGRRPRAVCWRLDCRWSARRTTAPSRARSPWQSRQEVTGAEHSGSQTARGS